MIPRASLLMGTAALLLASAALAGQDCKVTICHAPGGDYSKINAIEVGVDALDAHLAHGDFLGFNGSCHVLVDEPKCRDEAELDCQSRGGHLVSIHSDEENAHVGTLADMASCLPGRVWIGALGTGPDGEFCDGQSGTSAWTDGSAWDHESWRGTIEPNGCGSATVIADAIQYWSPATGTNAGWNDVNRCPSTACGTGLAHVCKLENRAELAVDPGRARTPRPARAHAADGGSTTSAPSPAGALLRPAPRTPTPPGPRSGVRPPPHATGSGRTRLSGPWRRPCRGRRGARPRVSGGTGRLRVRHFASQRVRS